MTTATELKSSTVRELAASAKHKGIPGWHAMRKAELIQALVKRAKADRARKAKRSGSNGSRASGKTPASAKSKSTVRLNGSAVTRTRRSQKRLDEIRAKSILSKDLAYAAHASANGNGNGNGQGKDRIILMVRDSYWLHAYWELTRSSIDRARAALGQHWHGARPVLRLWELADDAATTRERENVRDIPVHGGVNNWYIDVNDPPKTFQVDIGYLALDGRFLCLTRSNVVSTPQAGAVNVSDGNWAGIAADFDRVYALSGGHDGKADSSDLKELFEERLHRPMGSPTATRFGMGAQAVARAHRDFNFNVDAELVVYGKVDPNTHVTLKGEPVQLESDGTFSIRMNMPNRRQVLPVVACSADGVEQRTIVLAIERNTKTMEPVIREPSA